MGVSSERTATTRLLAGAAGIAALLAAEPAGACHDLAEDGLAATVACFSSIHAGVSTAVFVPADVHYALDRRWLPPEWAWPQLLLGSFATMGGGATAIALAATDEETRHRGATIGWGAGLIAAGGMHGSVATFSLQKHLPAPEVDEAWLERLPTILVVPAEGGAIVTASF